MTTTAQRQMLSDLIEEACQNGARRHIACQQLGLTSRTLQRWRRPDRDRQEELAPASVPPPPEPEAMGAVAPMPARPLVGPAAPLMPSVPVGSPIIRVPVSADHRQAALRRSVTPHNKLTPEECDAILALINSQEFKDLPPSQIVPRLADQGLYLASESTIQRLMRHYHQTTHRRSEAPPQKRHKPAALMATAIHQIYTWDITYLPTSIKGQYFYLYLFVDIFSRHIVGWQIYDTESAEQAAALLTDICLRNGISRGQVTLHSDNGSPMKGATMLATMQKLGVAASRSRPSVSNDNPFSESLFRTLKYRPDMPVTPFQNLTQARAWGESLVNWYNREHRHGSIGFVTPEQRHSGQDIELLAQRTAVYAAARQQHPERWSGDIRNWKRPTSVHLNPDNPIRKDNSQAVNTP